MRYISYLLLWVSLPVFAGCMQTAMLPADQLDSGETTASVSLHEPQFLYYPGASAQLTTGVGGGDVTANVAGGLGILSAGLGGRYYVDNKLNFESQVRVGVSEHWAALGMIGLQSVPTDDSPYYYGGGVGVLSRHPVMINMKRPRKTVPLMGGTFGIGRIELGSRWWMQIELDVTIPVAPNVEGDFFPTPNRISVGVFRLFQ